MEQSAIRTPVFSDSGISSLCLSSATLSTAYLSSASLLGVTVWSASPRLFMTIPTWILALLSQKRSMTSENVRPS